MNPVISKLKDAGTAIYKDVLQGAKCVALVDFPNHANVGDSAIWAGEKQILKELGIRVAYQCSFKTYYKAKLERACDGPVLIHGGGNFGDVWPEHENFRITVVKDFPERKIIQLPQSIHYSSQASLRASAAVYAGHPDFTVLTRDAQSQRIITEEMRLRGILCPDSAFFLSLKRMGLPSEDVLCLKRTDHEAAAGAPANDCGGIPCVDWLDDITWPGIKVLAGMESLRTQFPNKLSIIADLMQMQFDGLALRRVQKGIRLLSRARVVVTDRLHAHILCLLCGIPHVLIDNSYGKLSGYYESWTRDSRMTYWAQTFEEGVALAKSLAADLNEVTSGRSL